MAAVCLMPPAESKLARHFNILFLGMCVTTMSSHWLAATELTGNCIKSRGEHLHIKEQADRVFYHLLDSLEESHCLTAVDQPVVVRECHIHHWAGHHLHTAGAVLVSAMPCRHCPSKQQKTMLAVAD